MGDPPSFSGTVHFRSAEFFVMLITSSQRGGDGGSEEKRKKSPMYVFTKRSHGVKETIRQGGNNSEV